MIRRVKNYKIPLLLILSLFTFHLCSKDFNNPFQRTIVGDAQAYYAYLPALFIYGDLEYKFIPEINKTYYPESQQKSFLKPVGNGKVNKTFPGVAILYLPFFLIAHALALLFDLSPDGYSPIYQFFIDLSLWFYLFLGLVYLIKTLKKMHFSHAISTGSACILLLSTNLFFYSVYDQSVTHIYNFFLINLFIYLLFKLRDRMDLKIAGMAVFVIALIGITRPTNFLVFGLAFCLIPSVSFFKNLLYFILNRKHIFIVFVIALSVLIVPFILWKIQTGNWIVYSYGEEGFNFSDPHLIDFTFSYLKGWFIYTPIALLIMLFGFPLLFKTNRTQFFLSISFYAISIYLFSSWWCWYYGAGMGQRVMIDHYILLAFLLALILRKIQEQKRLKFLFLTTTLLFSALNIAQAYQIRYGILYGGTPTKEAYWDNFAVFEKCARIYPHSHWTLEEENSFSLDTSDVQITRGKSYFVENNWVIQVSAYDNYSASIDLNISSVRPGSKVKISFDARARDIIKETKAVYILDENRSVFMLSHYLKKDQWVNIQFLIEPNSIIKNAVVLYFWNGGTKEKVEIKNLNVNHYFSDSYL